VDHFGKEFREGRSIPDVEKATREDAIYDDCDKKLIWKDSESPRRVDGIYK
jgi:hypothetical protein